MSPRVEGDAERRSGIRISSADRGRPCCTSRRTATQNQVWTARGLVSPGRSREPPPELSKGLTPPSQPTVCCRERAVRERLRKVQSVSTYCLEKLRCDFERFLVATSEHERVRVHVAKRRLQKRIRESGQDLSGSVRLTQVQGPESELITQRAHGGPNDLSLIRSSHVVSKELQGRRNFRQLELDRTYDLPPESVAALSFRSGRPFGPAEELQRLFFMRREVRGSPADVQSAMSHLWVIRRGCSLSERLCLGVSAVSERNLCPC